MNLLRKLSFSLVFVLAALSLRAQAVIDLSAYIDDETAAQLGDNNAAALKNKISKIITRNGMADAAGLFVVTPTLTVTDDGTVDTGMTTVHVVRADLTLSVKNLFENTVFASQTVSLQANGKSEEACMRSLINKVNVNDVRFAKMIKDVQQSIADYYTRQMPKILAKVNSLVAREEYEDAMAALAVIPESVDEYEAVEELKKYNVDAELINLPSIVPLDYTKIVESVKKTGRVLLVSDACTRGSFLNDIAQNISTLCFGYLDAPPAIVGAQNWITPPFEFDEFYSPSKEWIMDAIHEQLLPLENYVPTTSVTDVERMRRLKAGV